MFSGGLQEFECEIALFRRTPGSEMFSTVVSAGDTITLGEELHLRSIVRAGDGTLAHPPPTEGAGLRLGGGSAGWGLRVCGNADGSCALLLFFFL